MVYLKKTRGEGFSPALIPVEIIAAMQYKKGWSLAVVRIIRTGEYKLWYPVHLDADGGLQEVEAALAEALQIEERDYRD